MTNRRGFFSIDLLAGLIGFLLVVAVVTFVLSLTARMINKNEERRNRKMEQETRCEDLGGRYLDDRCYEVKRVIPLTMSATPAPVMYREAGDVWQNPWI